MRQDRSRIRRLSAPKEQQHDSPGQRPGDTLPTKSRALKGRNNRGIDPIHCSGLCRPFRAWRFRRTGNPGRCPGLACCAPLGLKSSMPKPRRVATTLFQFIHPIHPSDSLIQFTHPISQLVPTTLPPWRLWRTAGYNPGRLGVRLGFLHITSVSPEH